MQEGLGSGLGSERDRHSEQRDQLSEAADCCCARPSDRLYVHANGYVRHGAGHQRRHFRGPHGEVLPEHRNVRQLHLPADLRPRSRLRNTRPGQVDQRRASSIQWIRGIAVPDVRADGQSSRQPGQGAGRHEPWLSDQSQGTHEGHHQTSKS